MKRSILFVAALLVSLAGGARAQDANYIMRIDSIEPLLREVPLTIIDFRGARAEGDRTQRVTLTLPDGGVMVVQLAKAPAGGTAFNNEPRYELAAFRFQLLFLEPDEYVVPPTVVRAVPLDWLRQFDRNADATFNYARQSVVVALKYWLMQVTPDNFYSRDRARQDTVYARYIGNFNLLTHLIRHSDSNVGNFLISQSTEKPRVFSVDNGVAFESQESNRGYEWRNLRVERVPRATIDRLREVTPERLRQALGVLVQFEVQGDALMPAGPGENIDPGRGVRRRQNIVQFGLTEREIRGVENRIRSLIQNVDRGRISVF